MELARCRCRDELHSRPCIKRAVYRCTECHVMLCEYCARQHHAEHREFYKVAEAEKGH